MHIPDEYRDLILQFAAAHFIESRNQYHDLERRFGVGHADAMKAKGIYDQARRLHDEVNPAPVVEQVA